MEENFTDFSQLTLFTTIKQDYLTIEILKYLAMPDLAIVQAINKKAQFLITNFKKYLIANDTFTNGSVNSKVFTMLCSTQIEHNLKAIQINGFLKMIHENSTLSNFVNNPLLPRQKNTEKILADTMKINRTITTLRLRMEDKYLYYR